MSLVMFDYDGVIVDSFQEVRRDFIAACRKHGFEIDEKIFETLHDDNCYKMMREKYGLEDKEVDAIVKEYEQISKDNSNLKIFEGMKEAIEKIAQEHTIVIITSNTSQNVAAFLEKNGIKGIKDILGADLEQSKIKKINKAVQLYPTDPAYYVGDTTGDIIEGKKAGVITVAVSWGWHKAEKLKKFEPDYLVYSPQELLMLFCAEESSKLNKKR